MSSFFCDEHRGNCNYQLIGTVPGRFLMFDFPREMVPSRNRQQNHTLRLPEAAAIKIGDHYTNYQLISVIHRQDGSPGHFVTSQRLGGNHWCHIESGHGGRLPSVSAVEERSATISTDAIAAFFELRQEASSNMNARARSMPGAGASKGDSERKRRLSSRSSGRPNSYQSRRRSQTPWYRNSRSNSNSRFVGQRRHTPKNDFSLPPFLEKLLTANSSPLC